MKYPVLIKNNMRCPVLIKMQFEGKVLHAHFSAVLSGEDIELVICKDTGIYFYVD